MATPAFRTKVAGSASVDSSNSEDILDEALNFFRVNLLFKNYDIQGPGDVLIIYMTVFITQCLRKVATEEKEIVAQRVLVEFARQPVQKPNEPGFFMRGIAKDPTSAAEAERFCSYLKHAKEEIALRLVKILYKDGGRSFDNKFWMGLSKRNFMNLKF